MYIFFNFRIARIAAGSSKMKQELSAHTMVALHFTQQNTAEDCKSSVEMP